MGDQIGDGKGFCEGDEEAAGTFDEQGIAVVFYVFDAPQDFFQRDFPAGFSERHEWSDGIAEIKRIRFVVGQFSGLE